MSEKTKGRFSKIIVVLCILEMAFMQFWAMKIASDKAFLTDGLILANHAVFGGELLLLCLKRILAPKKDKREGKNDEISNF